MRPWRTSKPRVAADDEASPTRYRRRRISNSLQPAQTGFHRYTAFDAWIDASTPNSGTESTNQTPKRHQSFANHKEVKKALKCTLSLKPLNLKGICNNNEGSLHPLLAVIDDKNNIQHIVYGLTSGVVKRYSLRTKEVATIMDMYSPVQYMAFVRSTLLMVAAKNRCIMVYRHSYDGTWKTEKLQRGDTDLSLESKDRMFPNTKELCKGSGLVDCFPVLENSLITVENNATIKLWDKDLKLSCILNARQSDKSLEEGSPTELNLIQDVQIPNEITSCDLTADGNILAMGLSSGNVVRQISLLRHHKSRVQSCAFSPVPSRLYRSSGQFGTPHLPADEQPPLVLVTMAAEIVWWDISYEMRMRAGNKSGRSVSYRMNSKLLCHDETFSCFVTVDNPGHIHIMNVIKTQMVKSMAQFNYLNEIKSLATMDGPLSRGALQRFSKKSNNENINTTLSASFKNISNVNLSACNQSMQKLSVSANQSCNNSVLSSNRTPTRNENKKGKKTPSKNKSPGRSTTPTPNKASKTPNKADRFIPSRSNSNYDLCHYMMNRDKNEEDKTEDQAPSAAGEAIGRALGDTEPGRLLQYTCKAPAAPEGYQNRLRVVYSQAKVPSSVKNTSRYIPQAPDRILDAPDILDDYCTGQIEQLLALEGSESVTSVGWMQGGGSHLAVGTSAATVELWDCERIKRLRVMDGHTGRVGAIAWNMYIMSSGARDGNIVHHDVRQREHAVATIHAHTQEVMDGHAGRVQHVHHDEWRARRQHRAPRRATERACCRHHPRSHAGGNGRSRWPRATCTSCRVARATATSCTTTCDRESMLSGLAWCPWSAGVLASGGGTADRTIRIWNINTGANLNTVDTKSQVCSIVWSTHYKELISGHGYANNQLVIWKYPLMSRVAELTGHMARVLHLALNK
ncbi:Fizzy [Operophtera brumata]|uniref:Fizzy n=1 Tax=Operophtera brumata TaxID=104452 RepID=A0A0L7L3K7_OPEBR|nr:Fizzy [Operophtera brumata]